jgi:hypothetical protein
VAVVLAPAAAPSGTLDDFERDATKRDRAVTIDSTSKKTSDGDDHDAASDVADACLSDLGSDCLSDLCTSGIPGKALGELFGGIAAGGRLSQERIEPDSTGAQKDESIVRKSGEALIPFLRVDALHQEIERDVTATDLTVLAGYGPFGVQMRRTVYREEMPDDRLRIAEYHVLYRMSAGRTFEVDLGAGAMVIDGKAENSGFSLTLPLLWHPKDFFGIEFRPLWSTINENDIQDYDLSVLLGWRYCSVRAGYRWVRSPNESLDGPQLGASIRW